VVDTEEAEMKRNRSTGTPEKVDPKVQETAMEWYARAKFVDVYTTTYSEICLFKRRGYQPEGGKAGEAAAPYLHFKVPRRAITIRSKRAVETKKRKIR
jgi:hypothetical protein